MFHSILILYSFLVFLFFLPLLGYLLKPATSEFLRGVRTLALLPFVVLREGRASATKYYQERIRISATQFSLLVLVLFANVGVVVIGLGDFSARSFSVMAGLFLFCAALCAVHLAFGNASNHSRPKGVC